MTALVESTNRHRIRVSDDARYLTIGQVRERFGVSDMWVWRYTRDHGFPRPVRFGGPTSARHWLLTDIEQWERDRARQNKSSRPAGAERPTEKISAAEPMIRG